MNEYMQEIVTLYSAGAIPGIPGEHGAGTYLVDWNARTITPVQPSPQETPVQEPVQPSPTPVQEPLEEPPPPVQDVASEQVQEEDAQHIQTSVQANNSPSIQGG